MTLKCIHIWYIHHTLICKKLVNFWWKNLSSFTLYTRLKPQKIIHLVGSDLLWSRERMINWHSSFIVQINCSFETTGFGPQILSNNLLNWLKQIASNRNYHNELHQNWLNSTIALINGEEFCNFLNHANYKQFTFAVFFSSQNKVQKAIYCRVCIIS